MDADNQPHPLGIDAPLIRKLLANILALRTSTPSQSKDGAADDSLAPAIQSNAPGNTTVALALDNSLGGEVPVVAGAKAQEGQTGDVTVAEHAPPIPTAEHAPPIPAQQAEAATDGPVPTPPAESPATTPIPEAIPIPEVLPAPGETPRPQPDLSSTIAAITPLLSGMGAGAGVGMPSLANSFSWEDGKTGGVDSGVRQLHQAVYGRDLPAGPAPAQASSGLGSILPMALMGAGPLASPQAATAASGIAGLLEGGSGSPVMNPSGGSGGSGAAGSILPMAMAAASLVAPELAPMAGEAAALPEVASLMSGEGAAGAGGLEQLIPKLMSGGEGAGNPFGDILPSMADGDSPFTSAPAWMPTENPFSWSGASGQAAAGNADGSTEGAGDQGQKIDGLIKAIESLVEVMKGSSGSQSDPIAGGGMLPALGQGAPGRGSRSTVPGTMADGIMSSWLPAVMRNSGR